MNFSFRLTCLAGLATFLVTVTITVLGPPAAAQEAAEPPTERAIDDPLPLDPNVRIGRLENGLTYYIRRNTEPENRAELYLAIDAGSILEDEDQLGIAHFVEHMLFNGTERYPNEELIDFLESTGMRFGPDVNAYTSFDETVFTLTVPTDSAHIVEDALEVLVDWASNATLSEEMIDKERGVVVEEWRMSDQNAQGRIRDRLLPAILHGSRYKNRLPIGKPDIIENASYDTIRRFYETWYRPDLMAVIAVGDFDSDAIEDSIRTHFAALQAVDEAAPRLSYDVPGHDATLYEVISDPEYPVATVSVYFKRPRERVQSLDAYRSRLIGSLFNGMLNERLEEISRRGDAPFIAANVFKGGFVRPAEFYGVSARVDEDSVMVGLQSVLVEVERVRRHGFAPTELQRQKLNVLRAYETAFQERDKTNSATFAQEYVSHFLEDEPTPGIAFEYDAVQRLLPEITLEEVNQVSNDLVASENRAVVAILPEKEDLVPPTEDDLADAVEIALETPMSPYVDEIANVELIDEPLTAHDIVSETIVPEINVTILEMANGVRVIMKPTDFKEDEIRFTAFSPGGSSLVDDEEAFEAETSASIVARSGVGSFDRTQLEKLLAGKVVSVSPYVNELKEGFNGSASPRDLETLFQLIHLYFTSPRADENAVSSYQNQMRSSLENRAANPLAVFNDSLSAALYGGHVRRVPPTLEMVASVDVDDVKRFYGDRFQDAGDFTFVFAGSFDVDTLRELAQTYLGSLPSTGRDERPRDVAPDLPTGVVETSVYRGMGEQSWVAMAFHGPISFDRENRHQLRSLADVLRILLRRDLREDRGGVYGVSINTDINDWPDETYTLFLYFSCAPDRVDELSKAVLNQIQMLKSEGPPADVVSTIKEQQRRERETAMRTNDFWVSVLDFYYSHDEDVLDVLQYYDLISALTSSDVQEAAMKFLDEERVVRGFLFPESRTSTGE